MPIATMCAPTLLAWASAWFRLARSSSSSSSALSPDSGRGETLSSMLYCPSSVWKSGSAMTSSTVALAIAGAKSASTRLSSISRPVSGLSTSKLEWASICSKTSRHSRTRLR